SIRHPFFERPLLERLDILEADEGRIEFCEGLCHRVFSLFPGEDGSPSFVDHHDARYETGYNRKLYHITRIDAALLPGPENLRAEGKGESEERQHPENRRAIEQGRIKFRNKL